MGFWLGYLMGIVISILFIIFADTSAKNVYEKLKHGEQVCIKNGGLKSFDYADNFACNDGALFSVEKKS